MEYFTKIISDIAGNTFILYYLLDEQGEIIFVRCEPTK